MEKEHHMVEIAEELNFFAIQPFIGNSSSAWKLKPIYKFYISPSFVPYLATFNVVLKAAELEQTEMILESSTKIKRL